MRTTLPLSALLAVAVIPVRALAQEPSSAMEPAYEAPAALSPPVVPEASPPSAEDAAQGATTPPQAQPMAPVELEAIPLAREPAPRVPSAPDRLALLLYGGVAQLNRSHEDPRSVGGITGSIELAYAARGVHGARLAVTSATALFGPNVLVFDLCYAVQWNSAPRLQGVTWSLGGLIGPALGIVNYTSGQPLSAGHVAFGGRAGLFADLNLAQFNVGIDTSIRAGTGPQDLEWMWSAGLHLGFTLELGPPGASTAVHPQG